MGEYDRTGIVTERNLAVAVRGSEQNKSRLFPENRHEIRTQERADVSRHERCRRADDTHFRERLRAGNAGPLGKVSGDWETRLGILDPGESFF